MRNRHRNVEGENYAIISILFSAMGFVALFVLAYGHDHGDSRMAVVGLVVFCFCAAIAGITALVSERIFARSL
jgi:hypothetical protein